MNIHYARMLDEVVTTQDIATQLKNSSSDQERLQLLYTLQCMGIETIKSKKQVVKYEQFVNRSFNVEILENDKLKQELIVHFEHQPELVDTENYECVYLGNYKYISSIDRNELLHYIANRQFIMKNK
jgi:hypothetical protein